MSLFTRVISGDSVRKTRLHDEKGNLCPPANLIMHGPPAIITGLLRILVGYIPEKPWIAYSSIRLLDKFLDKKSRVLEFGSGMSTIWFASHAGEVNSVEHNKPWHKSISSIIRERDIRNVNYKFAEDEAEYASFMADDTNGFDLVLIDGRCRSKCLANASKLVRPGGILYLDNSDKDSTTRGGDMRLAESALREFAEQRGAAVTEVVDFAPAQLFVQQGLYTKLPI